MNKESTLICSEEYEHTNRCVVAASGVKKGDFEDGIVSTLEIVSAKVHADLPKPPASVPIWLSVAARAFFCGNFYAISADLCPDGSNLKNLLG